jgi:AcrR family transcriptional regulator
VAKSEDDISTVKRQRREKILDAAQNQFVRCGFRATTMEGIAEAVGMSKVTVYGYFTDKDELFAAVGTRLGLRLRQAVFDELEQSRDTKVQIAKALGRKHGMVFDIVRQSPFAAELFAVNVNLLSNLFKTIDREIIDRIALAIQLTGRDSVTARRKAELIFNAAQGIANAGKTREETVENINELVGALLD